MTIKELKEIIADLPDEAKVYVETNHEIYWEPQCTDVVEAEYYPEYNRLYIDATIKDD